MEEGCFVCLRKSWKLVNSPLMRICNNCVYFFSVMNSKPLLFFFLSIPTYPLFPVIHSFWKLTGLD